MLTKLTDKVFNVSNPVEVDAACESIRRLLAENLPWVSHPYHIAQRFYKLEGTRSFYYPETYLPNGNDPNKSYHTLTPNNAYKGMFFFVTGTTKTAFEAGGKNMLVVPVGLIFSVNLELIDCEKLKRYLFTQELLSQARQLLTEAMPAFDFQYTLVSETRDLKDTYREFVLKDIEQYNRAPLQCFRIDLNLNIHENC